ncbi:hypothetical protein BDW74DRAFT_181232 [Aspergillus multicolor]|uniref:uncharacterized protein n=1 Tax=Aspergillus multicolor TaxID=41759 RepID=UPI003CCCB695
MSCARNLIKKKVRFLEPDNTITSLEKAVPMSREPSLTPASDSMISDHTKDIMTNSRTFPTVPPGANITALRDISASTDDTMLNYASPLHPEDLFAVPPGANKTACSVITAHTDDTMLTHIDPLHPEPEFQPKPDWVRVSGQPDDYYHDAFDYDIGIAAIGDPQDEDQEDPYWMIIVHDLAKKQCRWYALGATKKWWEFGCRNYHGKCLTRTRTPWTHKLCDALHDKRRLGTIPFKDLRVFEQVFASIKYQERKPSIEFISECLEKCIRKECILEASILGLLDELAGKYDSD